MNVQLITKLYQKSISIVFTLIKFLFVCFPTVFNYAAARQPITSLSSHLSQSSDRDRRPRDGKSEQMGLRPKIRRNHPPHTFHPLGEEWIGCVIPDWRLEVAWHLREWRSDVSFIILCNDLTAFALLCLNYGGLELLLKMGAATKPAWLFYFLAVIICHRLQ